MPQMAPLSWLSLYMIFTIILIVFCVMNYYLYIPMTAQNKSDSKKSIKTLNWKW